MKFSPFILLVVCVVILLACRDPRSEEIAGNYQGEYFGGVENFSLSTDGKFSQKFTVGGNVAYTNNGSWALSGRAVTFSNFVKAYWFTDEDFSEFRDPIDQMPAKLPVGTSVIVFSEDGEYLIRKQ